MEGISCYYAFELSILSFISLIFRFQNNKLFNHFSSETGSSSRHMHYPYHHSRNMSSGHGMHGSSGRRKTWDDEHVLKRKFSALIPAFDPRPGNCTARK